jgi:hypothetical protein
MHIDPQLLRAVAYCVILLVVFGSRFTTGLARQTAEGLVFGIKPMIAWTRATLPPAFVLFFLYVAMTAYRSTVPWGVSLLFFAAAVAFILMQVPGTITLTPTAITQRFWFRQSKIIQYNEVMAIQAAQGGRITRVLGDNRVKITHTLNHSAAKEFRQELERRTGKRVIA